MHKCKCCPPKWVSFRNIQSSKLDEHNPPYCLCIVWQCCLFRRNDWNRQTCLTKESVLWLYCVKYVNAWMVQILTCSHIFVFQLNICGKPPHMWKKGHRCLRLAGRPLRLSHHVLAALTLKFPTPSRYRYRATADTSPSKCATSPAAWPSLTQKTGTAHIQYIDYRNVANLAAIFWFSTNSTKQTSLNLINIQNLIDCQHTAFSI